MADSRTRANLDKPYAMAPGATGNDAFGHAVQSTIDIVSGKVERGEEFNLETWVAQQATAYMEVALENEKKSEKAAKEALEASETAKNLKENAKAWFEMLCGLLDDDGADAEPQTIEAGAPQEEDTAHGA